MDIGHIQIMTRIIAGPEHNGTTIDIRIAFHNPTAVSVHALGLIEVLAKVFIDILGGLFYALQDVVNLKHCYVECLPRSVHGFFLQHTVGERKHRAQRYQKDKCHDAENNHIQSERRMGAKAFRQLRHADAVKVSTVRIPVLYL